MDSKKKPLQMGPVTKRIPGPGWKLLPGGESGAGRAVETWDEVWVSGTFQVLVRALPDGWIHLSIKRRDQAPIRSWRTLQTLKSAVVGPEREAVELYPAESRHMDTSNQYHLWVLPRGVRFPLGYEGRAVVDGTGKPNALGAVQEPLGPGKRYGEVLSEDEAIERAKEEGLVGEDR